MAELIAETERLRLRTWDPADIEPFDRHTNTPAVMRWLGGVLDRAGVEDVYRRLRAYQRDHGHSFWVVERRSDDAFLGFCGLKRVNSPGGEALHGDFEVGWRLREDAWGMGYAREAAIESLDLAFGWFGAPHVVALTVQGNLSSQGLMKRLGMRRREDLDFDDLRHPDLNPCIVYRIDSLDWPAARARAIAPSG